jgi:hypothetical protein
MSLTKLPVAMVALACLGHQGDNSFMVGGVKYFVSNVDQSEFTKPPKGVGESHLKLTGSPAQIQSPERGLTVRGRVLESYWVDVSPKIVEVTKGRVEGGASIVIDDELAQRTAKEMALKAGKKAPTAPTETTFMEVDSEQFSYAGTTDNGAVTIPNPWTFRQTSKGIQKAKAKGKPDVDFDQTVDADGSAGLMNLVKGKDGNLNKISTGHLDGPVHMKIVRNETEVGSDKTGTTSYIIVADFIDVNLLTQPGTVRAVGHVTLDTDDGSFKLHFTWDKCVFAVDENLQLLGFHGLGTPGITTAKPVVRAKDGSK